MFNIKMLLSLFYSSFLCFVLLQVAGEDSVKLKGGLHGHSIPVPPQVLSETAVMVPNDHLRYVSRSVLMAESWTRTHVMAHYPGVNITTIVAGHNLLCENGQEKNFSLVLPSLKNIHYSLTRWGLHKEIQVSASFSSACLLQNAATFRTDIAEIYIKPLLSFLQEINSPYLVNPHSHLPTLSDEYLILLKNHSDALKNLGFLNFNHIHVDVKGPKEPNPRSRKLTSFLDDEILDPFPARPTPLSPTNAPPAGSSAPSYAARSPLPPWLSTVSPPPEVHPMIAPANPHYGFHFPPCNPSSGHGGAVAAPVASVRRRGLWCVAKPSVPPEALQQGLDYACGQGGADCAAIGPRGSCYYPNTVLAHASYAFNSYWQKNKGNGGTCGFGGTAMLIDSDPSYGHCRFTLGL